MTRYNTGKALKQRAAAIAVMGVVSLLALPAQAGLEKASYQPDTKAATHSAAPNGHKVALQYDIYAGGFKALNANITMDLGQKAYDMKLNAATQGFIGDLFPWKASYNTAGHAANGRLIPAVYTARSTWRDKQKITEMNYSPEGHVLKTTTQEGDKTKVERDIDRTLSQDALDLLSGTLAMLQNVKSTNHCEGKFPVFDGKRRYNITLKDDGEDVFAPSEYSRFEGKAIRCILEVEPVAGFSPKDQKRGWMAVQNHTEERHKLPTLWFAPLKDSGQVVPVRMEIASAYGSVVAHLSGGSEN